MLYQVPTVHCSISTRGRNDITFCKPNFIQHVLNDCHAPVLYVDADIVFREPPLKILQATRERADFASYNWLADKANDGYAPVNSNDNQLYRFSHAFDWFDPTQLVVSGAVQYYAPDAQPLLQAWLDTIERFPNVADDHLLDYAYNFVVDKNLIRTSWLDKGYCRYPWWIQVRPVIEHPEFPATEDPSRRFRSVTGYDRVKLENIKHRMSQGPFPRDCLIDTTAKRLLRLDASGRAIVVARFATELWIDRR